MKIGLFGKLPTKRDFVAFNAPRSFLTVWENWVQAGIAASRSSMGAGWTDVFLQAPIWRFWLGPELCKVGTMGALMPSVDGVGRYFPLSIFGIASEASFIEPPVIAPQDDWFGTIEAALLNTLDQNFAMEPAEIVSALTSPRETTLHGAPYAQQALSSGVVLTPDGQASASEIFPVLRQHDMRVYYGKRSYWWTIGGEHYSSHVVVCDGMPLPYFFENLLTGNFGTEST